MSTAASGEDSMASKCLAFCQALVSQGQVFNFSLSIGSDFTLSLDTRSKAFKSQGNSPSTLNRNARRRAEFMAKKQQIPQSQTSKWRSQASFNCVSMWPMWLLGCLWNGAETTRGNEAQESWRYTCSQIAGRVFKVCDWLPSSPSFITRKRIARTVTALSPLDTSVMNLKMMTVLVIVRWGRRK